MEMTMMILVVLALVYYGFRIIQVMIKLRQRIAIPATKEERSAIRKHPQKITAPPTVEGQKNGLIINAALVLFIIAMFTIVYITDVFSWHQYLFMLLFLAYSYFMLPLNLFAVKHDGILIGMRFIPWKRINTIYVVPIDKNHRYYGFSQAANQGYVLKIKIKYTFGYASFVITSEQILKRILRFLKEHVKVEEKVETSVTQSK
ncbi:MULTISPECIES: hypothetical protein [Clostridia]|uniref:hypothetical protein n=1 Tax=Clostridia TaxID=186801 RepID=UPI000EA3868B|nr:MULTISPECIES: hypothetical protein [Clostridia]NBJ67877.1 hypothetical protein [Roseburia sp. 1XD42-34]RKI82326.1 hypothetical protein D7V87_00070 [Clostridium sp. 1xD42-85]